ncbi:MAG: hypothetical protein V1887_01265 [Candidatus Aenigmatarchaeota archaeon]
MKEVSREAWWHPYSWDRFGTGMSIPRCRDYAGQYGLKERKLRSIHAYGFEDEKKKFLPTSLCIELEGSNIMVDRAIHRIGQVKFYNLKGDDVDLKMPKGGSPYLMVNVSEEHRDPRGESPFKKLKPAEIRNETSEVLSEFLLSGNDTCAVGSLPGSMMAVFEGDHCMLVNNLVLSGTALAEHIDEEDVKKYGELHLLEAHLCTYTKESLKKWKQS